MHKVLLCFISLLCGLAIGVFTFSLRETKISFEDEVFRLSLIQSEYLSLGESYLNENDQIFKTRLMCRMVEQDVKLQILAGRVKEFGGNLNIYGGKGVFLVSSEYLFDEAELDYLKFREDFENVCRGILGESVIIKGK